MLRLKHQKSPAGFSGMAVRFEGKQVHACRRGDGQRIKKSRENIILRGFSLSSDTKPHSRRVAKVLLVSFVPACSWGALRCPLHLALETHQGCRAAQGVLWEIWDACDRAQGCGAGYGLSGLCFTAILFLELVKRKVLQALGRPTAELFKKMTQILWQWQKTPGLQYDQNYTPGPSLL